MEPLGFNPYAPPQAELAEAPEAVAPGELRPVPFEDRETLPGFWKRVLGMFATLFTEPGTLAQRIPVTESLGAPFRFCLILAVPLLAFFLAMAAVMGGVTLLSASEFRRPGDPSPLLISGIMAVGYPLFFVAWLAAGTYLGGPMLHGALWAWGGLKQARPLRQTVRTTGYFLAFSTLFGMVPLLGCLVYVAGPAALGLALAKVHRTNPWRGICAAYTPFLLCGGIYAGSLALFFWLS